MVPNFGAGIGRKITTVPFQLTTLAQADKPGFTRHLLGILRPNRLYAHLVVGTSREFENGTAQLQRA